MTGEGEERRKEAEKEEEGKRDEDTTEESEGGEESSRRKRTNKNRRRHYRGMDNQQWRICVMLNNCRNPLIFSTVNSQNFSEQQRSLKLR